jgi:hypothetical protein
MQTSASNDLEINTFSHEIKQEGSESISVSNNLRRRIRKKYYGGYDQREFGKTCLEKIHEQVQEKTTLDKLRKYNYQMNLLKKLEGDKLAESEKITAIEEYNYLTESSKYTHNVEAGGLYKDWNNIF